MGLMYMMQVSMIQASMGLSYMMHGVNVHDASEHGVNVHDASELGVNVHDAREHGVNVHDASEHGVNVHEYKRISLRNLKTAYFTQHHVDQLVLDVSALELIQSKFPGQHNSSHSKPHPPHTCFTHQVARRRSIVISWGRLGSVET